jgi:hypothetical protein
MRRLDEWLVGRTERRHTAMLPVSTESSAANE